jgi:hypothetical protein
MDIAQILTRNFFDDEWTLNGEDYADLIWRSESKKPTEKELKALWPQVKYEVTYEQVERARARAYRKISDALFFEYQRGDATEAEWLTAVQAVKDAHPYPEQV